MLRGCARQPQTFPDRLTRQNSLELVLDDARTREGGRRIDVEDMIKVGEVVRIDLAALRASQVVSFAPSFPSEHAKRKRT